MNEMLFLCINPKDLEDEIAFEIIKQHPLQAEVLDITYPLARFSDATLVEDIKRNTSDYLNVYLFDNVPIKRLERFGDDMVQLKKTASICQLVQVAALLHHRLTHFELLVAAYATDGIVGAKEAGATRQELDYIVLRDRIARSGSARKAIEQIPPQEKDCYI